MGLLGVHASIAGGVPKAIERGEELRCEAIQLFTQSSRTWATVPLTDEEVRLFQENRRNAKRLKSVIAHNSYLLNLSTPDEGMRRKSVRYFIENMERCERLGIDGLVTHPGSHLGAGLEAGLLATSRSFDEVLKATKGFRASIIIENTAGQGDCVGCEMEHLVAIAEKTCDPDRLRYCFDTQHAFAAGYDLRSEEGYEATFEKWDRLLSFKRLAAFHVNDAVKDLGCRVDRHANIGKGFLGKEPFRRLVNDARFKDIPMCLETDPGEDCVNWKRELKLLRSMMTRCD